MGLYFFSGKGGVGKTHLATSFASHQAEAGRRTVLVEFSQYGQYSEYFDLDVAFRPVELEANLSLSSWTGRDALGEYVGSVLKSQKASDFFMKMPLMGKLINAAPGLKEISILGKLTSDDRETGRSGGLSTGFEDVVFDAPASGHFLSLLRVPESLAGIVGVGPMKKQCSEIIECLKTHEDVFFTLIDDGSVFSKKEAEETEKGLRAILGQDRKISRLHNLTEGLSDPLEDDWLLSAKKLKPYWDSFSWK